MVFVFTQKQIFLLKKRKVPKNLAVTYTFKLQLMQLMLVKISVYLVLYEHLFEGVHSDSSCTTNWANKTSTASPHVSINKYVEMTYSPPHWLEDSEDACHWDCELMPVVFSNNLINTIMSTNAGNLCTFYSIWIYWTAILCHLGEAVDVILLWYCLIKGQHLLPLPPSVICCCCSS